MDLGERLKSARKNAGLSQSQLGQRSGLSQQMIWKLETGVTKKSARIVALAIACGVRSEWLDKESGPMISESEADPEVIELAGQIQSLPPQDRARLRAIVHAFIKSAPDQASFLPPPPQW